MIDIPPALIEAITDQRAVLFLGAGASVDATHPNGERIPQGDKLRDLISDKYLGGQLKTKPLSLVADMAANEAGLAEFQKYIYELFSPYDPAPFHLTIPRFRWRAIVTTNFDLLIERAYSRARKPIQNLVKTVKDGDGFDARIQKQDEPVGFLKLHGCIEHYTDSQIPIVLGVDQYNRYDKNRSRLYGRVVDLGHEYPIVFVGYSISDAHIQKILFDLTDPEISRPPFYYVAPGITPMETRYWVGHKIHVVDATFEGFLRTIDQQVTPLRNLSPSVGGGDLSIRKHYRVANPSEPSSLVNYIKKDVDHVHSGLVSPPQDARQFFRGYDNGWGCIIQNLDVTRTVSDSVMVDAILVDEEDKKSVDLWMLKGPAGNGKSIALKRIAWDSAVTYDKLSLYVKCAAGLRFEPIAEVHRLTGARIYLFVDHVALMRNELHDLLRSARHHSVPISVVGAERYSEWNWYCNQLEPYLSGEFAVNYLSEREIGDLLGLLERHNALGALGEIPFEQRVRNFVEIAERQLLVALHELTLGVPFEEIVVDEFRRIEPSEARNMYLDICGLHQFGAPVRAGLISRCSGIRFEEFQERFIEPLEKVVFVIRDGHSGDVHYRSRHAHVAEIVFNAILPSADDKFDAIARIVGGINVDYTADWEAFQRLIRGREIARMFSSVDVGRTFYNRIQSTTLDNSFVAHQRAVFELNHGSGSLELAQEAADRAFELGNGNHSIRHTQSEIARRMANETDDELHKRVLRRTVREKLDANSSRLDEYDLGTRARVALDELRESLGSTGAGAVQRPERRVVESAKEVELAIQRGLQAFPDSTELLSTEATFREVLSDSESAQKILERAFSANPSQDWLAVRLSRRHQNAGNGGEGRRVLEECLRVNPGSKMVHLELGRLASTEGRVREARDHLRRSFVEGDSNFEGQFWYNRELFIQGEYDEARRRFDRLHERAPGRFRIKSDSSIRKEGKQVEFEGRVTRKEYGYAFLKLPQFPGELFASRGDSERGNWDALASGDLVRCKLAFNRRGARANDVRTGSDY